MNMRYVTHCASLLALLAPAPLLAALIVKSNSSSAFYIIRQDIMDNLEAPNDRARYRMIEHQPFGPHPIGSPIFPKVGATFWVFPECGPDRRMKPESRRMVRPTAENTTFYVECG
jgi:hypothetical protein